MMITNKYSIRRDALISPWGVGAIAPFPHDESLMVAGLDYWFSNGFDYKDFIITDERLSERLKGKLFVYPPDFRKPNEDRDHAEMRIPAVRFPLWHYCPVCGNMEKLGDAGDKKRCSGENRRRNGKETSCSKKAAANKKAKLPLLIPERFVAVCEDGHIEDFPIMEWVHAKSKKDIKPTCRLYRTTGGTTSSLSGVRYTCTCGASASMKGAFVPGALDDIGCTCTGNEPWLGHDIKTDCGKSLKVLQRGASNVWFADVISSIYIPISEKQLNKDTKDVISKGIAKFKSSLSDGEVDKETIIKFVDIFSTVYDNLDKDSAVKEIVSALIQNADKEEITEDEYRKQEFDVLTRKYGTPDNELCVRRHSADEYDGLTYLSGISLVHKLRETRVFTGFKRIDPSNEKKPDISIDEVPWLPAVKNSGEGIMFEFKYDLLDEWSKKENVISRTNIIETNLKNNKKLSNEVINPVYVLLHTFSHCLINALSNESGYSNASIREKIYCPKYIEDDSPKMAGILIYTASGDSEGSLGGLVRQGKPGFVENIIARALSEAGWCASDPVCIQSPGQGQDGCNLAACHNCALLPETSCENKNALLDRGLLIGTLSDATLGFFSR